MCVIVSLVAWHQMRKTSVADHSEEVKTTVRTSAIFIQFKNTAGWRCIPESAFRWMGTDVSHMSALVH